MSARMFVQMRCMAHARGRGRGSLNIVVNRESPLSRLGRPDDSDREVGKPSTLRYWGGKFGLRAWTKCETHTLRDKGT